MDCRSPDIPNDIREFVLAALSGPAPAAVLDARPAAVFAAAHLRGAVSWPQLSETGAVAELEAILPSIFLPPRHRPLLVMAATAGQSEALARALAARGRSRVTAVSLDEHDLSLLPARWIEHGPGRPTLWEAPRWLSDHADLLPPPALGPVLDLGCGSGRAAVWLAERGYRVTGVDRQPEALALLGRLAASRGVSVATAGADVRDPAALPPGAWAVVVNVRCLDRGLLARLHRLVLPGGVAVVRTFRDAPGLDAGARASHRLRAAELARAFASGHWRILAHEEGFDDDGRPAAGIVARRLDVI